jgi:quinol monooxygenase YgiN
MAGVRLMIQFTADSVQEADKLIEAAVGRCAIAQQHAGCLQFEIFRSELNPEKYALIEHWESEEALAAHQAAMPPGTPASVKRTREKYAYQGS